MYRQNFIWIFTGLVIAIPALLFTGVKWYEDRYQRPPVLGGANHRIDDFKMKNSLHKIVVLKDWDNKIVVADFFFTYCGTVCPKMTKNLKKVQDAFPSNDALLLNSFSIDPERDSSERLAAYAIKHKINQANWHLLTGDKREIYRLARNSFLVTATDGDGGPDDFIHSDLFVLVDTQKRIRGFYKGTDDKSVDQLISDIGKLMNE